MPKLSFHFSSLNCPSIYFFLPVISFTASFRSSFLISPPPYHHHAKHLPKHSPPCLVLTFIPSYLPVFSPSFPSTFLPSWIDASNYESGISHSTTNHHHKQPPPSPPPPTTTSGEASQKITLGPGEAQLYSYVCRLLGNSHLPSPLST